MKLMKVADGPFWVKKASSCYGGWLAEGQHISLLMQLDSTHRSNPYSQFLTVKSSCYITNTCRMWCAVCRDAERFKSLTKFLLKDSGRSPGMQQPGPATKGNRVRQLHISCGSSPLTQPLISLAAAEQSPYLYLPGIAVLTAEREHRGWGGYV